VDAYLTIAEQVLQRVRRPLTARQILKSAYQLGFVPKHLHGSTQHKTLGARLSEDILERHERSLFYRNAPGKFFLSEFLNNETIPLDHRTRFLARRRRRQLPQHRALALSLVDLMDAASPGGHVDRSTTLEWLKTGAYEYAATSRHPEPDQALVWSYVVVLRGGKALTYRHGVYREDRDAFTNKRGLGFYAPVTESDRTLFDLADHGIVSKGLKAISIDLGLSSVDFSASGGEIASLDSFVLATEPGGTGNLLSVIRFEAPDWFEPYARRLAINDLEWLDLALPLNHVDDFDPWSELILSTRQRHLCVSSSYGE
jgi:hypothetical protein